MKNTFFASARFRAAKKEEADAVLALYRSVIGTPFCTWNEFYPGAEEIDGDLKAGNLFVLEADGKISGAISIVPENELDALGEWSAAKKAGEFARVAVAPEAQGNRLARILVSNILAVMKERGFDAVHISVAVRNLPARNTYRHFGFRTVGQTEMWGNRYDLLEREIIE